jgi:hypothetical protein
LSAASQKTVKEPKTVTLYRPVGQKVLDLIAESGYRRFPPRLDFQPIIYPVLNEAYATKIARDWDTKDEASGFAGYVTRFRVRAAFVKRYPVRRVGAQVHREYWMPAQELAAFNDNIVGPNAVIARFPAESSGE